ncbi:MAG: adenine phosphoribosyltransferase [Candidatus Omnitrophica bacterium]|nr:adenine phosphoribosyltransferase [Candidatus Omnitrophota bacterium]MBU4477701.1 adenine phosphoribosyltransferase [Candidatus Omnitrophota bacterium]
MLSSIIRDVPDFPKKGIIFKDITTLLQDADSFKTAIDALYGQYKKARIDSVVCVEARGFIIGAALAYKLNTGLVLVRKKGKLPYKTYSITYALEYGTDTLQIHQDAINKNSRVLIIDDVLATGGTIAAVSRLLKKCKANICGIGFLIELTFLNGRKKLKGYPVTSIIKY